MVNYSFQELAQINFMYGRANGNAYEARNENTFPSRPVIYGTTEHLLILVVKKDAI